MNLLSDALEDFKKSLSLDTKNPIIFSNMGLVLRKMDDFETAAYCYSQELVYS
jgi:lipoprotein NlpI